MEGKGGESATAKDADLILSTNDYGDISEWFKRGPGAKASRFGRSFVELWTART